MSQAKDIKSFGSAAKGGEARRKRRGRTPVPRLSKPKRMIDMEGQGTEGFIYGKALVQNQEVIFLAFPRFTQLWEKPTDPIQVYA